MKISEIAILQEQLRQAYSHTEFLTLQIQKLQEQVSSLLEEIRIRDARIDDLLERLTSLEQALLSKNTELAKAQNIAHGLSKIAFPASEKQCISEDNAFHNKIQKEAYQPKDRGNNGAKRKSHPEMDIECQEEIHYIYPDNDHDWKNMTALRFQDSIRYEMKPACVIRHIYRQAIFRVNGKFIQGKAPAAPLFHSNFGSSFIAGVAELRFLHSMPIERIANYMSAHNFEITPNVLTRLLARATDILEPLYRCLEQTVLEDDYISCDESYMKILIPANDNEKDGKNCKRGYIWVIIAKNTRLAYYFYEKGSRSHQVIYDKLCNYKGTIQSDGYKPYRVLGSKVFPDILRLPCLQHIKRKFLDCKGDPDADAVIKKICKLYHLEHKHKIGETWSVEDNLAYRQKYAPSILNAIEIDLRRIKDRADLLPESLLNDATTYMLNEMEDIKHIFQGGAYDLDNNECERCNRRISLSRRNSLFFGSDKGAERGAMLYSIVNSCCMQNVNVFDYFTDILDKIAQMNPLTPISEYRDLLPDRWNLCK